MKRLLNIFFIFIFVLFFHVPVKANQNDLIFAQVTDLHFFATDESVNNFENLIKSINSDKQIKFVVFTGDNIDKPNDDLLKAFLYFSHKIHRPKYFVIGDSDCFKFVGLPKKTYLKYMNKVSAKSVKSFNYYIKKDDYILVFVDGAREVIPAKNGYYKEDTLKWLDKILTKYYKKDIIVFQHFPVYDLSDSSSKNLYKSEEYIDLLKKHKNIVAVFSGHYHFNDERVIDDILHITTEPAQEGVSSYRKIYVKNLKNQKPEIYSQIIKF